MSHKPVVVLGAAVPGDLSSALVPSPIAVYSLPILRSFPPIRGYKLAFWPGADAASEGVLVDQPVGRVLFLRAQDSVDVDQ